MSREACISEVSKELHITLSEVARYFNYLDELKKSGQTKFFGGIPKLMDKYKNLTRREATTIVMKWMEVH